MLAKVDEDGFWDHLGRLKTKTVMLRIKKGDVDSGQDPPCKFKVPFYFMLCGPIIKQCVWKIYFEPKRIPTAKRDMDG